MDEAEALTQEVSTLKHDKSRNVEMVKKALLRGVCALNMETMTIMSHEDARTQPSIQEVHSTELRGANSLNSFFNHDGFRLSNEPTSTSVPYSPPLSTPRHPPPALNSTHHSNNVPSANVFANETMHLVDDSIPLSRPTQTLLKQHQSRIIKPRNAHVSSSDFVTIRRGL